MKLTTKEQTALKAITQNALDEMGGSNANDLHDDNYSWFNLKDITNRTEFNDHEASGLISSLAEKGLICDTGEASNFPWIMTEEGINVAHAYAY